MKNESGIYPIEYKALIRVSKVEEKTEGGIIIPDVSKDREQFAQMQGELVALSPKAFSYEDWGADKDVLPKPGDRVLFAKFAGVDVRGKDGASYRIVNDKDIAAVLK